MVELSSHVTGRRRQGSQEWRVTRLRSTQLVGTDESEYTVSWNWWVGVLRSKCELRGVRSVINCYIETDNLVWLLELSSRKQLLNRLECKAHSGASCPRVGLTLVLDKETEPLCWLTFTFRLSIVSLSLSVNCLSLNIHLHSFTHWFFLNTHTQSLQSRNLIIIYVTLSF